MRQIPKVRNGGIEDCKKKYNRRKINGCAHESIQKIASTCSIVHWKVAAPKKIDRNWSKTKIMFPTRWTPMIFKRQSEQCEQIWRNYATLAKS